MLGWFSGDISSATQAGLSTPFFSSALPSLLSLSPCLFCDLSFSDLVDLLDLLDWVLIVVVVLSVSSPTLKKKATQKMHLSDINIDCCLNLFQRFCKQRRMEGRKEGNVLFNDALNTFYFYD